MKDVTIEARVTHSHFSSMPTVTITVNGQRFEQVQAEVIRGSIKLVFNRDAFLSEVAHDETSRNNADAQIAMHVAWLSQHDMVLRKYDGEYIVHPAGNTAEYLVFGKHKDAELALRNAYNHWQDRMDRVIQRDRAIKAGAKND